LFNYCHFENAQNPTVCSDPTARVDWLEIFTLNPKDWLSFAVGLEFVLKGLIAAIDTELYY